MFEFYLHVFYWKTTPHEKKTWTYDKTKIYIEDGFRFDLEPRNQSDPEAEPIQKHSNKIIVFHNNEKSKKGIFMDKLINESLDVKLINQTNIRELNKGYESDDELF